MSVEISSKILTAEHVQKFNELTIRPNKTQFNENPKPVNAFVVNKEEQKIYIPIRQFRNFGLKTFPRKATSYPRISIQFTGTLLTAKTDPDGRNRDQNVVAELAMAQLKEHHSVFLQCHTGFGKTVMTAYLICQCKFKTLILCHLDNIKGQFLEELQDFTTGAKIQIVKGNVLDPEVDVYIMGIHKALKFSRENFKDIGFVIVDEAHICTGTAFEKTLFQIQPWGLVGLSATPDARRDGLDRLLHKFFGTEKEFIVREEVKNFTVIRKWTQYKPNVEYTMCRGKTTVKWTEILSSLARNEERLKEIAKDAIKYTKDKIIILLDRIEAVMFVYNYLVSKGENTDYLTKSKASWDRSCRILVAGVKKGGVGLNDKNLTLLILGCDMTDVRQCEGRIRTTDNIVIDYRDDYYTLDAHGKKRDAWYRKRGASFIEEGECRIKRREKKTKTRYIEPKFQHTEEEWRVMLFDNRHDEWTSWKDLYKRGLKEGYTLGEMEGFAVSKYKLGILGIHTKADWKAWFEGEMEEDAKSVIRYGKALGW